MPENFEREPSYKRAEEAEKVERIRPLDGFQKKDRSVTEQEIQRVYEHGSSFTGINDRNYFLGFRNREPYYQVTFVGDLPDNLTEEQKNKFVRQQRKIGRETKDIYSLAVGSVPEQVSKQTENYRSSERRESPRFKMEASQKLTIETLAEEMKEKKVVFYTGAGISKASNIPDLKELMKEMGIDIDKDEDEFLVESVAEPRALLDKWAAIKKKMAECPPTRAHEAMTNIAESLDIPILTENVDILHERAGAAAYHVNEGWMVEDIKSADLQQVDMIVTVGLGRDDNNFLAEYKDKNPTGIIVAINEEQPGYLGDGDKLIDGDLQELVPMLEKVLLGSLSEKSDQ